MFRAMAMTIAMTIVSLGFLGNAWGEEARQFDLPVQELAASLNQLAVAADWQLVYAPELVKGMRAPALSGFYTPNQALQKLLEPTKLKMEYIDAKTIAIRKDPPVLTKTSLALEQREGTDNKGALTLAQNKETTGPEEKQSPEDTGSGSDESPDSQKLQEIVVTAQKREEKLQDVPTSMVVLSGETLSNKGFSQLSDYAKLVPGLRLIGASRPGEGKAVLRGISSGADRTALVGIYLDDVPFVAGSPRIQTANLSFDPALADIERIEVLKGPQSTLYGASALGGLIKYVTKKPDTRGFDASVRVGGSSVDGGDSGYNARLSVNIPFSDTVALRASAFYRDDPGYVNDIVHGIQNVDHSNTQGVRASLLFNINDKVETIFTGLWQEIDNDGSASIAANTPSLNTFSNASHVNQHANYQYRGVTNTTTVDFNFATLTNIASYAGYITKVDSDLTGLARSVVPSSVAPTTWGTGIEHKDIKRYSDEIRLASAPGTFEWMLGAWYTQEDYLSPQTTRGTDTAGNFFATSSPYYDLGSFLGTADFNEKALFGNVTYHLTDTVKASGGVRYSRNNQEFFLQGAGLLAGTGYPRGFSTQDSSTDYLATVSYEPTDALTFYVRAASGYRPGGPNNLAPELLPLGFPQSFTADSLWNYEVGAKGAAFNGLLHYSLAGYFIDWSDIQINISVVASGVTRTITGNAGKASSKGAEFELNFALGGGLSAGLSGTYVDAKLEDDAVSLGARSGNSLPYSPKFSSTATLDYRTDVSDRMTASAGLIYNFIGSQANGFGNFITLPSYRTLDLNGGLEWSKYRLNLTVNNVFNSDAVTSVAASDPVTGGTFTGFVLRPRTIGLQLEYSF